MQSTKHKYADLFDLTLRMCGDEEDCTYSYKEALDTTLFPHLKKKTRGNEVEYVLYFNNHLDIVLALYDAGIFSGVNTANAIVLYVLFLECIYRDNYDEARFYLDEFKYVMNEVGIKEKTREARIGCSTVLYYQTLFLLLHEYSHIFYQNNEKITQIANQTTFMNLEKLRYDYESIQTEKEMLKAFERVKDKVDWGYVLKDCKTEEERKAAINGILDQFLNNGTMCDFIDDLLKGGNRQYVEELNCDRWAFLQFVKGINAKKLMPNTKMALHKMLYIAFSAMDNLRLLRTYYTDCPTVSYGSMAASLTLRHRCFLLLDSLYGVKHKRGEDQYADIDSSLDTILSTEFKTINMLEEHVVKLKNTNVDEIRFPDQDRRSVLLREMKEETDDFMGKVRETPPDTFFPKSVDDFKDEEMGTIQNLLYILYADIVYCISTFIKKCKLVTLFCASAIKKYFS